MKYFSDYSKLSSGKKPIPHLQRGFGGAVGVEETEVGEIFKEGDVVGALSF